MSGNYTNKPVEPINYPADNLSAHFKRYIQKAALYGSLNMPIYENRLVNLNKG